MRPGPNWLELIIVLREFSARKLNKGCFWIISALETGKWSQITLCILTNVLTFISERFCPNFEQIKLPSWPVGNRGRFSNMSGLSYLTCVKLNWPISDLRTEYERNYSTLQAIPVLCICSLPKCFLWEENLFQILYDSNTSIQATIFHVKDLLCR